MTITAPEPILLSEQFTDFSLDFIVDPDEHELRVSRAAELPDPTGIICSVAHAAVDAFHGSRPVQQLARAVSPQVFEQLAARARAHQEINRINGVGPRVVPTQRRSGVLNASNSKSEKSTARQTTRVIRARVLRISPIAAEATVIIQDGPRVRAAALRAEEFRGRWRITVLQIG